VAAPARFPLWGAATGGLPKALKSGQNLIRPETEFDII
jgi:hypothetical protein